MAAPIRLRLRGPDGKQHTRSFPAGSTCDALKREAANAFNITSDVELLLGFPPAPCSAAPSKLLSEVVRSGDTVVVRASGLARSNLETNTSKPNPEALQLKHPSPSIADTWACSKCTLENPNGTLLCAACGNTAPGAASNGIQAAGSEWRCQQCTLINPLGASSCGACGAACSRPTSSSNSNCSMSAGLVKMPDDNSCLFHCIVYLLDPASSVQALRTTIANEVRTNPRWDEATLGKTKGEYVDFITNPIRWGGQVEIAIFSFLYRAEIAVMEVQSGRCDVFGEGCSYGKRVYLLHSGIHFDAISFEPGAQRELIGSSLGQAHEAARQLAAQQRTDGAFVDQDTVRLRCKICGFIAEGDLEARAHAGGMGHKEFALA